MAGMMWGEMGGDLRSGLGLGGSHDVGRMRVSGDEG